MTSGIRLHPPLVIAVAALAAWGLEHVLPLRFAGIAAGAILAGAGVLLGLWAVWTLHRAGTAVPTWKRATALVAHGPFRFSRNPIYVAILAAMTGAALWLGTGWGLLATAATAAVLATAVVPKEEAYLRRVFGAAYDAYAACVRRWV